MNELINRWSGGNESETFTIGVPALYLKVAFWKENYSCSKVFLWLASNILPKIWGKSTFLGRLLITYAWKNDEVSAFLIITFMFSWIICSGLYCVKSVQIRSFSGPYFPSLGLITKTPYSVRMLENTDQKKLRIWTLFMRCWWMGDKKMSKVSLLSIVGSFICYFCKEK